MGDLEEVVEEGGGDDARRKRYVLDWLDGVTVPKFGLYSRVEAAVVGFVKGVKRIKGHMG